MGIFKDLGFKNRDGKISAPSAEKFAGYTLDEVKNQINPTFVYVDSAVDGQAVISGTSLPTTIAQDASWVEYQPVAYGFESIPENIGTYIKTIYSNNPVLDDRFSRSCSIGSSFMLIGSHFNDDKATDAGKVEMFDLNGTYIKTIYSNDPAIGDYFGVSCAIGDGFIMIGSHFNDDKFTNAGKVEMFTNDKLISRKLFINDVEQVIVSEEPGVSTVDTLNILNDNSCIATYKLDGNVNDLSGNYNGSVTAGTITYPYGVFDKCASFNGSSRITHSIEPTDAFSVSFWAYFNNTNTNSLLFDFGNGYTIYRYVPADSRIRAQYKGVAGNNTSTTINHNANTWNHFVVNFTSTSVSMYVDGVLQINTAWNNYINSYGKTIGMRSDNWGGFDGKLDQIRVFNKVLSQSEITTLYNESSIIKGKTTFETSLVNNVNELSIRNEGLVDSVEINFYEGV